MAYELLPGIKQDHKQRLYQIGRYPNGKLIEVPYTPDPEAKPAQMIPIPQERPRIPAAIRRTLSLPQRKRLAHVVWRDKNKLGIFHDFAEDPEVVQRFVDEQCRPLMRFDGKQWLIVSYEVEYFNQYHTEADHG